MKKALTILVCAAFALSASSCSFIDAYNSYTLENDITLGSSDASPATDADGGTVYTTAKNYKPDFTFSTTDRSGKAWDESIFNSYDLVMINFWEPWCSPCVSEMRDIERLYKNYKDRGVLIIGVYSDDSDESNVDTVLSYCGTTYPILHYTKDFDQFQSGYVPTTIFVDREGHVLKLPDGETSKIGAASYEDWVAIISSLL